MSLGCHRRILARNPGTLTRPVLKHAGVTDSKLFEDLTSAIVNHPRLGREKPKALLRIAARLAASGVLRPQLLSKITSLLISAQSAGKKMPIGKVCSFIRLGEGCHCHRLVFRDLISIAVHISREVKLLR
jgi:hypothetical protein